MLRTCRTRNNNAEKKCHEPHKSALQTPNTRMSIYYSYCNFVLTLKLMFM